MASTRKTLNCAVRNKPVRVAKYALKPRIINVDAFFRIPLHTTRTPLFKVIQWAKNNRRPQTRLTEKE